MSKEIFTEKVLLEKKKKKENEEGISKEKSLWVEGTWLKVLRQSMAGVLGHSQEFSVHRAECEMG